MESLKVKSLKLNSAEIQVLLVLDGERCRTTRSWSRSCFFDFNTIATLSNRRRAEVRRICRRLARRGLLVCRQGLIDEDGVAQGSGYAITCPGQYLVQGLLAMGDLGITKLERSD